MSLSKSEIFLSEPEKTQIRTDFEKVVDDCCETVNIAELCKGMKGEIISFCIDHNIRFYNLPSLKYNTRADLLIRLFNFINTKGLQGLGKWKDDFAVFQASESIGLKEQHHKADKTVKAQHERTGEVRPDTLLTLQDMADLFRAQHQSNDILTTQPFSYSDGTACGRVAALVTDKEKEIFLPIVDDGHWFSLQRIGGVWFLQDSQPTASASALTPRQVKILRNSQNFLAEVYQGNSYGELTFQTSADQFNDYDCGSRVVNNYRAKVDINHVPKTHEQILQEAFTLQNSQGQLTFAPSSANSSRSTTTTNTDQSVTASSSGVQTPSSSSLGKQDQSPGKSSTAKKQDNEQEKQRELEDKREKLRLEVEAARKEDQRIGQENQRKQEERREQENQRIETEKREQERQREQEEQHKQEKLLRLQQELPSVAEIQQRHQRKQSEPQDVQQDRSRQSSPRFFPLGSQQEMQFQSKLHKLESALEALETKAVQFGKLKGNYDEGSEEHSNYEKAENAARGLKSEINDLLGIYKTSWDNPVAYETFKNASDEAVGRYNKTVLSHHRDLSKTIVANVLLAILGLGVIYGIVLAVDSALHHGRRPTLWQTQSERKAYTVEDLVDDLAPPTREM